MARGIYNSTAYYFIAFYFIYYAYKLVIREIAISIVLFKCNATSPSCFSLVSFLVIWLLKLLLNFDQIIILKATLLFERYGF
jgi:hypothetical protein